MTQESGPPPVPVAWKAKIRRWLWLDGSKRTDRSRAVRGSVYTRNPVPSRRFLVLVVTAGIVIALVITVVRDAEALAVEESRRLVFEEAGFAVSVPADWDVDLEVFVDPELDGHTTWAAAGEGDAWEGEQGCVFHTSPRISKQWDPEPPRHAEEAHVFEWLDLPAGRVLLVEDLGFRPHTYLEYRFGRGISDFVVACHSLDPPADRWRSIAETFEFLYQTRDVVAPELELRLTFPDEWTVREDRTRVPGAPGWVGYLWATDGESICRLQADTDMPIADTPKTEDDARAVFRAWLEKRHADVTDTVEVDLPSGPALRTDWTVRWREGRMPHNAYELHGGEARLRFHCNALEPPEDRWLSLVETIAPAGPRG